MGSYGLFYNFCVGIFIVDIQRTISHFVYKIGTVLVIFAMEVLLDSDH